MPNFTENSRKEFQKFTDISLGPTAVISNGYVNAVSARKRRYKDSREFLAGKTDVSLHPVPFVPRWNSWFRTVNAEV